MKSNLFNLSHEVLLSGNQGELLPIGWIEGLPGDTIRAHSSALVRVQPLLAPLMHKVEIKIHHWFVPFRLIWDDFEDFITGGPDGTNASVPPYITSPASTGFLIGSLADYLGIPPGVASKNFSALPFRAYAFIWNEFYRDQDLQTPLTISKASGLDTTTSLVLQNACWEKDYFTSARPEPQKGTDVALPLTGDAPVLGIGMHNNSYTVPGQTVLESDGTTSVYANAKVLGFDTNLNNRMYVEKDGSTDYPNIHADLSNVTAATVNDLRLATALQRYKENMMRFGSRYIERLRYFGVPPMDARLQLPEYLGGGKQTIQFSEVLQTAEGTDPVGEMRGHGISALRSNQYKRYLPEHGIVISMLVARPRTVYPQAVDRLFLRQTKEEFFTPELQHIGQQEVYTGEVYAGAANQYGTFGYIDRYDEYRRKESRVAGEFRDTLDFWHMAREFASEPSLNADFVKSTPTTRVYAATNADQLYIRAIHKIKAKRKIARTGRSFIF